MVVDSHVRFHDAGLDSGAPFIVTLVVTLAELREVLEMLFGTLILMLGGAAADALVAVQIGSMVDQLTRLAHSDAEQQPPSGDALALPVASSSLDTALALLAGLSIAQALAHFAGEHIAALCHTLLTMFLIHPNHQPT